MHTYMTCYNVYYPYCIGMMANEASTTRYLLEAKGAKLEAAIETGATNIQSTVATEGAATRDTTVSEGARTRETTVAEGAATRETREALDSIRLQLERVTGEYICVVKVCFTSMLTD
jgi:hypothetical protein